MFFKSDNKSNPYLSDPDVKLMLDFKNGDKIAFENLMKKYFPPILNFIYKFIGRREIVEEIAQEVFIRVYKSGYKYEPKATFKTWLYTIAHNLSLNEIRRNKNKIFSLDAPIDVGEDDVVCQVEDSTVAHPDEELLKKERQQAIRVAIVKLPKNQRIAVILRRYDQFSYQEIANTMKTSEKAVKSLLSRAKENLKNALSGFVNDEE